MKYALQVAVVAMTLFSVSAALSLWLNQQQKTDADKAEKTDKAEKKATRGAEKEKDKEKEKDTEKEPAPKGGARVETAHGPAPAPAAPATPIGEQERRLERRQAMTELIQQDLQVQMKAVEALVRQMVAESKAAVAKVGELDAKVADLDKKKVEVDATERKNIERVAALCDGMPPESAALVLSQMADSGKMDTVVKVLAAMKEAKAARVMGELDPTLAGQLMDKMRGYKVAPAPTVVPAGRNP